MVEKAHTAAGHEAGAWPRIYEPLRGLGQKIAGFSAPNANAATTSETYEINIQLPGVPLENVDVSVHDKHLTIQGQKRAQHEEKDKTSFFTERQYGAFQRSFRLPPRVTRTGYRQCSRTVSCAFKCRRPGRHRAVPER